MKPDVITTRGLAGQVIHISMTKTATSSLQHALDSGRLAKRDIKKVKAHLEMRKKNPNKKWGYFWA